MRTLDRNERLAALIDQMILEAGDELTASYDGLTAVVTDVDGFAVVGMHDPTPETAAAPAGVETSDGWAFWQVDTPYGSGSLADLLELAATWHPPHLAQTQSSAGALLSRPHDFARCTCRGEQQQPRRLGPIHQHPLPSM